MSSAQVPTKAQVLVIGGGPGGSYTASCLAREGFDVVLLEADKFPRYHVGESMLLSMRHFLRFIDLEKKFDEYGFNHKPGAAFKLNPRNREGYTDFIANNPADYSWNVVRSESDALLFRHAAECGAKTFDGIKVTTLDWDGQPSDTARITGANYISPDGTPGHIDVDWVVDASGRAGIISTKYLKTRKFNVSLKNIACWAYWSGCSKYMPNTPKEGAPFFEALHDSSGWVWFIPLHDGTCSVGVVMNQSVSITKKSQLPNTENKLRTFYEDALKLAPRIRDELMREAELVTDIKQASDFSYSSTSYAGRNHRIVGDAGAFLDPFFSSGVHLALAGGLGASASIASVIRGECSAEEAKDWYTTRVGTSYTRFLLVVLSAYRQMQAQTIPVLSDINEKDFDRAFGHFREIIQGKTDTQKKPLSQDDLRKTVEFCMTAFAPRAGTEANASFKVVDQEDLRMEARKALRTSDTLQIDDFVADNLNGLHIRLEHGSLGLERA